MTDNNTVNCTFTGKETDFLRFLLENDIKRMKIKALEYSHNKKYSQAVSEQLAMSENLLEKIESASPSEEKP